MKQLVVGAWVKVGAHISFNFKFQDSFDAGLRDAGHETYSPFWFRRICNPAVLNWGFAIPSSKSSG